MIPVPSGVRVWLAAGVSDMRRGMNGLALQVQQALERDPHVGDLYVFRGRRGDLVKILWHDGLGMSLYAKWVERGLFVWPQAQDGAVSLTPTMNGSELERELVHAVDDHVRWTTYLSMSGGCEAYCLKGDHGQRNGNDR
jgi:transposase